MFIKFFRKLELKILTWHIQSRSSYCTNYDDDLAHDGDGRGDDDDAAYLRLYFDSILIISHELIEN